jgi:hypothetical protein
MEQVEEVKGIMQNNIENLVRNVDNLEVLQDKTGHSYFRITCLTRDR